MTTNTDAVLSNSSVNDRIVVDIDGSVVSCGTTIGVNQFNGEVIRIISVRSGQLDGIVVLAHHSAVGQHLVVLIPCEAVAAGRSRCHIGVHHDVVLKRVTHDRIGDKLEDRVRKNGDGVVTIHCRLATVCELTHGNGVVICGRIAVLGLRSLLIYRINCTFDDFTVAVPCEDLTAGNTAADMSGQGHEAAFADGVVAFGKIRSHAVNDRIFEYCDNHRVAGSDTERISLESRHVVSVFTKSRNSGVGQLGSSTDQLTVVIPVELEHVSIVVVQICSKGDLTTNTDAVFRNSSVNDRIVIHINNSFISYSTAIIVNQFNGEAVFIISVRSSDLNCIIMFTCHSTIGNFSIIFIPSVAEAAGRSRSDVSVHHDVVLKRVAHDRIGDKHENRIRVNRNSISRSNAGFATGSGLTYAYSIVINGNVTVLSLRSLSVNRINCARDNFTVAVPCEDFSAFNTTTDMSSESHITAFADGVVAFCKIRSNAVDNRIVIDIDGHSSKTEASLSIKSTILQKMRDLNNISSSIFRHKCLSQLGHTRNQVIRFSGIGVPLINQVRIIVVVEMSGKDRLATITNGSFRSGNVNNRFVININFERITDCGTTVKIRNLHSEHMRIVECRDPSLGIVVVVDTTGNAITLLTMLVPCIGEIRIIVTVDPSDQVDIVITSLLIRSEVTYIVVTSDSHDRITVNMNLVGLNRFRIATFKTEIDEYSVNIVCGILIEDAELFVESRSINTLQQNAILIPYISQRRINVVITCGIIVDVSGNINFFALTNGEISTIGESLIVSNNFDNLRIYNRNGGVAHNGATSGCLGNFNT